eukprot:gnl/MRDRNA2_/MRDRNA2_49484_c0_seq1.p1 gnl/MRDRNA2_/MRDRNA2_49484_c0~~gnl/MRDRNA2_/MRDRNA2_49484_c0_seq1.p1  ORF type:complete len:233 (-),score=57.19 gnl/MRDRNA2_/MRDRNA2_49484_c0_seq1:5-601(-)
MARQWERYRVLLGEEPPSTEAEPGKLAKDWEPGKIVQDWDGFGRIEPVEFEHLQSEFQVHVQVPPPVTDGPSKEKRSSWFKRMFASEREKEDDAQEDDAQEEEEAGLRTQTARKEAVLLIQTVCRGYVSRVEVHRKKQEQQQKEQQAAIRIQSAHRGKVARTDVQRKREDQLYALIRIQAARRAFFRLPDGNTKQESL